MADIATILARLDALEVAVREGRPDVMRAWPDSGHPVADSTLRNNIGWQSWNIERMYAVLREIAAKQGIEVDYGALAAQLLAGLAPALQEAIAKEVGRGSPDEIAKAVVARLGDALAAPAPREGD